MFKGDWRQENVSFTRFEECLNTFISPEERKKKIQSYFFLLIVYFHNFPVYKYKAQMGGIVFIELIKYRIIFCYAHIFDTQWFRVCRVWIATGFVNEFWIGNIVVRIVIFSLNHYEFDDDKTPKHSLR